MKKSIGKVTDSIVVKVTENITTMRYIEKVCFVINSQILQLG